MNQYMKMAITVALMMAVGAIVIIRHKESPTCCPPSLANSNPQTVPANTEQANQAAQYASSTLPRLVDLGAGKCVPCKMMAPVLEQLREEFKGKLEVVFIDVWENPDGGKPYHINLIPTQIFIAPDGKELFRHEGFFSKEDILAKWKELGFVFVE